MIPWNFPLLMLAWKVAPALACGNTVVLKPAETTPLTALMLADVCRQAELPAGVVNIVTGEGRRAPGGTPCRHRQAGVHRLDRMGKAIQRELAGRGIPLTLELGGKAANIVFDDCALDQAVEGIVNGIYFNQGQVLRRVAAAGTGVDAEPLMAKLKRRLGTLRVGDPLDKNTDVGAINSRAQLEKIRALVASGEEDGAEIYQPPCVLPDAATGSRRPCSRTSPSRAGSRARRSSARCSPCSRPDPDEAVEKANNTPYGLSAGVWTEKGSRILWMAGRLRAGVVWANTFNRFDPASPFGGYKESGFGREGGRHGLEAYLRFDQ